MKFNLKTVKSGIYLFYPADPNITPNLYIVFLQNSSAGEYDRDTIISMLTERYKQVLSVDSILVTTRDIKISF